MAYKNPEKDKFLKNCIEKAHLYEGFCLSTDFINSRTKLLWKCKETSHPPFESLYTNVVNGMYWCPLCSPFIEDKKDLADFLAKSKGGQFLEENYYDLQFKKYGNLIIGRDYDILLDTEIRLPDESIEGFNNSEEIKAKIKKTYKNRYFISINK